MRALLRFLALLLIASFSGPFLAAQTPCTPDQQYTEVGLYPDSLPPGNVGVAYDQVVHVVIPQDTIVETMFGPIQVDICELILDSIPNLPAGMSFERNTPDCRWVIDHTPGVINRGCVRLIGIPIEAVNPDDSLLVFAHVIPGSYDADSQVCEPLQLQLPDSLTSIEYKTALVIEVGSTAISIWDASTLNLRLFPNPSPEGVSTLQFELPEGNQVRLRVLDAQGRLMQDRRGQALAPGIHRWQLGQPDWAPGVYFIELLVGEGEGRISQTWIRQ